MLMFMLVLLVLVLLDDGTDLQTKSSLHIGHVVRNTMFLKIHDE
jgi:hypothetical protein